MSIDAVIVYEQQALRGFYVGAGGDQAVNLA